QARPPSAVWPASGADIIGSLARTNDPDAGCLAQDAELEVLVRVMHLQTSQATSVARAAFSGTPSPPRRGASSLGSPARTTTRRVERKGPGSVHAAHPGSTDT